MSIATLPAGDRPKTNACADDVGGLGLARRSVVVEEPKDTGKGCPNCGSTQPWGSAMWCPVCGYYPALGRTAVDVAAEPDHESVETEETRPMWQQIPSWVWVLAGGLVAVTAISFALKFTLADSPYLSLWSWVQFAAGVTGVLVGHLTAYLYACSNNDRITPFDIWMKPFAMWGPTLHALPKQARRLYLATWGLTAALMAVYVIGGVNFKNPLDLIEVAPPKKEKPAAKAKAGGGNQSMDEAMNEFADKGGAAAGEGSEAGSDAAGEADADDAKPNEIATIECLIVGYTNRGLSDFATLLLAAEVDGKRQYVGTLTARRVPEDDRRRLMELMKPLEQFRPAVPAPYDATWLKPEVVILVAFQGWTPNKHLIEPAFQQLIEGDEQPSQAAGDTNEPANEGDAENQTANPRGGGPAGDRRAAAKPGVR